LLTGVAYVLLARKRAFKKAGKLWLNEEAA
jgi:hypothetical protein